MQRSTRPGCWLVIPLRSACLCTSGALPASLDSDALSNMGSSSLMRLLLPRWVCLMFVHEVPERVVDLQCPEQDRWSGVIEADRETASRLVQRAAADIERVPRICRWGFGKLYQAF